MLLTSLRAAAVVFGAVAFGAAASGVASAEDLALAQGVAVRDGARDVQLEAKPGPYTLGLSNISVANTWRVQMIDEAKFEASRLSAVKELIVTDAGGNVNKQVADIEDLIARGVDALLVAAGSETALNPVLDKAAAKGIPVVVFSSDVTSDKYSVRILSDEVYFGAVGGEFLVKALNGKGKIIGLRGIAGIAADQERWDGAMSALGKAPGIEVIDVVQADWAYDKAKQACENLVIAHPEIDGVWSSGGAMTQACAEVFRDAGRKLVPMTGEANNGFLRIWREYELPSVAPLYPTWIGAEAVKAAVILLAGKPMKSDYMMRPKPIEEAEIDAYYVPALNDSYWVGSILPMDVLAKTYAK